MPVSVFSTLSVTFGHQESPLFDTFKHQYLSKIEWSFPLNMTLSETVCKGPLYGNTDIIDELPRPGTAFSSKLSELPLTVPSDLSAVSVNI